MAPVVVVTDSTSYLPRGWAEEAGIIVVPVQVIIGGRAFDETDDDQAEQVALALRDWQPVTTSRPSPVRFTEAFDLARSRGAESVAVITLSSSMSATHESAVLAARECDLEVRVVDSRTIAMGLGFAALTGARAASAGLGVDVIASAMTTRAERSSAYFYVDTLEYLRRGGRVGTAKAAVANALQVKAILSVEAGHVVPCDQVRTSGKALARLEALADEDIETARAKGHMVDVAVQHLAAPERAHALAENLSGRWGADLGITIVECPVGGVVGAHVGPGMVAVVVAPADEADVVRPAGSA